MAGDDRQASRKHSPPSRNRRDLSPATSTVLPPPGRITWPPRAGTQSQDELSQTVSPGALTIRAMDADFALEFAQEWEAAWNSHDLDRILTQYADDVVFSSPHIVRRLGKPSGEVHGIDELRAYWRSGLDGETDLHFTVEDVRFSVDTVVINGRNQDGHAFAEVLRFRDGLVFWGCGAYAPA